MQVPNKSQLVELRDNNNNIIDNIAGKPNNSSKNNENNNERLAKIKAVMLIIVQTRALNRRLREIILSFLFSKSFFN